jgi:glycosyltransferase involved in cell wall biosynthesis
MNPFFSIITVTKNTEKKVDLTIKSVLSQNFNNFEYIIVDGYSKDRTFSKIKEYKNKKIKVFRYKDRNFYDGLNYGVKQAKGKYIAILNSGDFFFSKDILITIKNKILKFDKYEFFFSNLIYLNNNLKINRIWKERRFNQNLNDVFNIPHPTIFIKNEIAKKFKYNVSYKVSSDLDFIIRLFKNKIKYKYLNIFTVAMEQGGMSSNLKHLKLKLREDLIIHRKYFKHYIVHFLIQKFNKLRSLNFVSRKNISNKILRTLRNLKYENNY